MKIRVVEMFPRTSILLILSILSLSSVIPQAHLAEEENNGNPHPSLEYELLRRRIEQNIKELWNFARSHTEDEYKLQLMSDNKNFLLSDLHQMRENDGHDEWRKREILELGEIIQKRLHYLQNPSNCSTARKLVCSTASMCGLGCKMHQLVRCFMVAYASNRTLLLDNDERKIYRSVLWSDVFLPLSDTCRSRDGISSGDWADHFGVDDPGQVLFMPTVNKQYPRPIYFIPVLPGDLERRMARVLVDPPAWWLSQFLKYLLRFQPEMKMFLDRKAAQIDWTAGPVVGIQVRRTDKLVHEAEFHGLEEYMEAVKDFYDQLEMAQPGSKLVRRVFIASDDPSVLEEARRDYLNYTFLGDERTVKLAQVKTRYSYGGFVGVLKDTYLLSRCDFVVCTFTSNVCRMAYEMSLAAKPHLKNDFESLDREYFVLRGDRENLRAVLPHTPRTEKEIELQPGDTIRGKYYPKLMARGIREGINTETGRVGKFPSFKVEPSLTFMDLPSYAEAEEGK